ncbi:putative carboxylesterase [Rosa chinensis]|uniref:Putative carboxylesterase n=1 Tax=Rosa chinensis TaxID=74649 RepID=A0A2P6Q0G0_ROSCH|nr:putative carboxylesterase [Rosa chinensis]
MLVAEARAIAVSINYRLAPKHPLSIAYEDSWAVLQWVFGGEDRDDWVKDHVEFEQAMFLVGDSVGPNIAHHSALRVKKSDPSLFMGESSDWPGGGES